MSLDDVRVFCSCNGSLLTCLLASISRLPGAVHVGRLLVECVARGVCVGGGTRLHAACSQLRSTSQQSLLQGRVQFFRGVWHNQSLAFPGGPPGNTHRITDVTISVIVCTQAAFQLVCACLCGL